MGRRAATAAAGRDDEALVNVALRFAARGMRLVPMRGKRPIISSKNATTSAGTICDRWRRWPTANVGAVVGDREAVLDIDVNAAAMIATIKSTYGPLPGTFTVKTGRGVRLTYETPFPVKYSATLPGISANDVQVLGAGHLHVLAGRHPSGAAYTITNDSPPASAPAWLVPLLERATRPAHPLPSWLPSRWPVGTRFTTAQKLAASLRARGLDKADILTELRAAVAARADLENGRSFPDRTIVDLAAWAATLRPGSSTHGLAALRRHLTTIAATWTDRHGRTDRRVLLEGLLPLIAQAVYRGRTEFQGAIRSVAAGARITDLGAVGASLTRLRADAGEAVTYNRRCGLSAGRGILERVQASRPRTTAAAVYRVRESVSSDQHSPEGRQQKPQECWSKETRTPAARDAWRRGNGLGWLAGEVWTVLSLKDAITVPTVRDLMPGMAARTSIYRALHRLERNGLAVHTADGRWLRGLESPADVAARIGATQATAVQRATIAAERQQYRRWLEVGSRKTRLRMVKMTSDVRRSAARIVRHTNNRRARRP